ncbi:MAG: hypothetical protein ABI162_12200 [Luteolibacter sp.]
MIHKPLLAVAVLGAVINSLSAQAPPALRAEIRMLAFTPDLQHAESYVQDPAAEPTATSVAAPIKSYLNHEFSTVVQKSRKMVFTTKPDRASLTREGETIGEVTLPEGMESAILLFLPGKPGDKTLCKILAINDSKRAFPAGSYNATNLSPLPIRLMLEQKNFDFKPGGTLLIENPPVREGGQSGMRTFAFKDNVWKAIASSLWTPPGEGRRVLVLFQDPVSGDVQLRAFDDDPPRAPAAKPEAGGVH